MSIRWTDRYSNCSDVFNGCGGCCRSCATWDFSALCGRGELAQPVIIMYWNNTAPGFLPNGQVDATGIAACGWQSRRAASGLSGDALNE